MKNRLPKIKKNYGVQDIIQFQLIFVLFERFIVQLGLPGAIIYILDLLNIFLFFKIAKKKKNRRYVHYAIIYIILLLTFTLIAVVNYAVYGNNIAFTILDVRNLIRFVIFFFSIVDYLDDISMDRIFAIYEGYFWINSVFIIYQYFTFFPANARWMRGDMLNGFFGTERGGNTFVNVQMIIVVFYLFVLWSKKRVHFLHMLAALCLSLIVAGMIELKVYYLEIIALYLWYLIKVKKTKKETLLNVLIICIFVGVSYVAIQLMIKEYPWFRNTLSIEGIIEGITSEHYSSDEDLNRFSGYFTIVKDIHHYSVPKTIFGIGLGNAAVSYINNKTTFFATQYMKSNYAWFQGTYLFIQCGLIGLSLYISSYLYLLFKKKRNYLLSTYSNMMILISIFLIFYGEALKTDAGYMMFFAIGVGFIKRNKLKDRAGVVKNEIVDNRSCI